LLVEITDIKPAKPNKTKEHNHGAQPGFEPGPLVVVVFSVCLHASVIFGSFLWFVLVRVVVLCVCHYGCSSWALRALSALLAGA
jgi:hypothetical protein